MKLKTNTLACFVLAAFITSVATASWATPPPKAAVHQFSWTLAPGHRQPAIHIAEFLSGYYHFGIYNSGPDSVRVVDQSGSTWCTVAPSSYYQRTILKSSSPRVLTINSADNNSRASASGTYFMAYTE
jgi:hypothetical protein